MAWAVGSITRIVADGGEEILARATVTDPRKVRTRDALIRAGISLFGSASADAVSIDDIIGAAGTSKQTFYNHFTDKQDMVREILRLIRVRYEAKCTELNAGETDPARRVARALCVYGRLAMDDPEGGRFVARMLMEDLAIDSGSNQGVIHDLALGLAEGRLSVLVLETGVAFIFGATQALVARILTCTELSAATAAAQQFAMLLLRAFGVTHLEAEIISAQAADEIVRLGLDHTPASQSLPSE
jgi:AcrR family transcriptional regulator